MAHTIIILGASGDLTARKLIPALYALHRKNRLPKDTRIVGFSRSEYPDEAWRAALRESVEQHDAEFSAESWNPFAENIFYRAGDIKIPEDFQRLRAAVEEIEQNQPATRLFYLATLPTLYEVAIRQLGESGMVDAERGEQRIIIEKPFGHDLNSARELNAAVHRVFREDQVFRIDHYLGKETVQNLLVLRFANTIFEPIWNRNYIDHVQITVAEEVSVENRGAFYDSSGVLRDMFQNHLLQLLMITAMEAPVRFEADLVRDEKVKVLRAIRKMAGADFAHHTVRGQYAGYLDAKGVAPGSTTATFAAMKLHIDNWRWNDVPFYLRSGKSMSCRTTQIVIQFREPPHMMFSRTTDTITANQLLIQIQPAEGIQLYFQTKAPDAGMRLRNSTLDFRFAQGDASKMPDAYQRLLVDALAGDASLFARSDEVEFAWRIIDPIAAAWESPAAPPLEIYEPGGWGPECSERWMHAQGRQWFNVCPVLQ